MVTTIEYFKKIKDECVEESRGYTPKEITKGMFERKEIVGFFSELGKIDEAYSFVVDSMRKYFSSERCGKIYVPGSGAGGLARKIMDTFPNLSTIQVDNSPEMIAINRNNSYGYKTDILEGDILNFGHNTNYLDAIVAYGIMRYIPIDKRNKLVSSWHPFLKDGGIVIVGEGISKKLVENINSVDYSFKTCLETDAKLFRCSLFYLLFNRYDKDVSFNKKINEFADKENLKYTDVLKNIAGFVPSKVYAKVLQK